MDFVVHIHVLVMRVKLMGVHECFSVIVTTNYEV